MLRDLSQTHVFVRRVALSPLHESIAKIHGPASPVIRKRNIMSGIMERKWRKGLSGGGAVVVVVGAKEEEEVVEGV